MSFDIILTPEAVEDLRELTANVRTVVKDALETHLRQEPTKQVVAESNGSEAFRSHDIGSGSMR